MGTTRSRSRLVRAAVAVAVLGVAALAAQLGLSSQSAEPTVQGFLIAWQQGQFRTAAGFTTGKPAQVAVALDDAYQGLGAAAYYLGMGPITQNADTASASFTASVDLGQDGAPWYYTGHLRLARTTAGWKILWSPSVINSHLRPGLHLAISSSTPPRQHVLDASGTSLQTPSLAYEVGVWPGQLRDPAATARGLGQATGLDPSQLLGWILAAPRGQLLELVTLRPSRYRRLSAALKRVPNLRITRVQRELFSSIAPAVVGDVGAEASSALRDQGIAYRPGTTVGLSGLQQAYQSRLAGTPTTKVVTETSTGKQVQVLKEWTGTPSQPVHTTIDAASQKAAEKAVRSPGLAGESTVLVAVQASTGRVLAVAEHTAPGLPDIRPLAGRYPPGTAFTIVSTEALLASGLNVDWTIPCPPKMPLGVRKFSNLGPDPSIGAKPPFREDFAHSCATAFAGLSQRLKGSGARDLSAAAAAFGLGSRWQETSLALPAFSGSVHPSGTVSGLAADTIGMGGEKVSPLAMALVAAEVDTGTWHAPSLVTAPGDPVRSRQVPVKASSLVTLQALMRDVVRSGAATQADLPGQPVSGQVGVVPPGAAGAGVWAHWFVGYRGTVAFAALTFSHSQTASAVPVAASFLASAPASPAG